MRRQPCAPVRCLVSLLLQIGLTATATAQTESTLYTIIDVGIWGTDRFVSRPAVVNNAGQVVSYGEAGGAYLWQNGVIQGLGGLVAPHTASQPRGINDQGQVVGFAFDPGTPGDQRPFRWSNGVMQDLGGLGPAEAHAISDGGEIAGFAPFETALGQIPTRAFLLPPGGAMQQLGTLPVGADPHEIASAYSMARSMNDRGQIVGESQVESFGTRAFLWENGVMRDLGTLPGGTFSSARDVNNLGQVVGIADAASGEAHAFLWSNGVMQDLGTLGGNESSAEAINDLGQIVGYTITSGGTFVAFLWQDGVMKDLNTLVDNSGIPGWGLLRATDINNLGDIVGLGSRGSRRTFLLRKLCRDTDGNVDPDDDGDGLCDNWETDGIDADGDGSVDLELYDLNQDGAIDPAERADPDHKDLFVEVDWMAEHQPLAAAIAEVVRKFRGAPGIVNPDGQPGIRLHVRIDEEALPHSDRLAFASDPAGAGVPHFDDVKSNRFGSASERMGAAAGKRLQAKRLAFRYAIFAHKRPGTTSSGRAELPGNDFVVSLGGFALVNGHATGNFDHQAATFMHEMGHTLNLEHGGSDSLNCKPNYLSIMSYTRQFEGLPIRGRQLDYSREKLLTLVESALVEPLGIGGPFGYFTAFGPAPAPVVPATGPIDWNRSGLIEAGVAANVNAMTDDGCDGEGDVLEGQNDWVSLLYDFKRTSDFADGVHATVLVGEDELTPEEALQLSPDTDGDGVTNFLDTCMFAADPDQADSDQDSLGNACDNCPHHPSPDPTDTDGDGRGNACECTDQDGDGHNTVSDLVAINRAIFGADPVSPLCDGNNDGACNVNDIVAANLEIFSPGNTSTCERQPIPGP